MSRCNRPFVAPFLMLKKVVKSLYYIDLNVTGQKITLISKPETITFSKNKIYARFEFGEEWKGQTNTAIFTSRGKNISSLL